MMERKRAGRCLEYVFEVLFGVLMLLIFYGTAILDKRANVAFPNTVEQANAVFYLAALILLWVLLYVFFAFRGRHRRAGETEAVKARRFYGSLTVLFLGVAVIQFFVSRWIPFPTEMWKKGDFTYVEKAALDIANGGSFASYPYFQISPNNLNIAIVVSWVYRLFGNQRGAIMLGALLTNASAILASLAVYNVWRREDVALVVALIGEMIAALNWRAFLVYTDNYCIIFTALVLWVYTTKLRQAIKVPLMILIIACGSYIKVTCVILLAALMINGLLKWLRGGERHLNIRRMALYTLSFIVLFGGVFALQNPIRRHYGFVPGEYPKGWQYMFMVGQNTEGLGAVGAGNGSIRKKAIKEYGDLKKVNQEFLRRGLGFIRERGLVGNLDFYERKLTQVYDDGYFHNVQNKKLDKLSGTFLYQIYAIKGKYYQFGAMLAQTLWDMVLLTMMLYSLLRFWAFLRGRRRTVGDSIVPRPSDGARSFTDLAKLIILGVTVYLLCLEGRSKYLFMFLPAFLIAFGGMVQTMGQAVFKDRLQESTNELS